MPRVKKEHRTSKDTGIEEKHCSKCDTWKPLEAYYKQKSQWDNLSGYCKTCNNSKAKKQQRELNATEEGRERRRATNRKSAKKRRMNGKENAYRKKRYKEDHAFRTESLMRRRINACFSKHGVKKNAKTSKIMGCTPEFLNAHLEKYFIGDMSWKNRDKWHIDHVVPCCAFGTSIEEQKILHWYDNLRPMWATQNIIKSGKYEKKHKIALIERYNKVNNKKYMHQYLIDHYSSSQ